VYSVLSRIFIIFQVVDAWMFLHFDDISAKCLRVYGGLDFRIRKF
jgi:hypothetical protein